MISVNNKSMTSIEISDQTKSILSIEPLLRSEDDLNQLMDDASLTQLSFIKKIFKSKKNNKLKSFMQCLKIFYLTPNEDVYKIGDKPKSCFFLLEGSLDIFIPEIKKVSNTTQFVIESKRQLKQGEMFGEKELITLSSSRESTVRASTACLIGKITKRDYFKLFDMLIRRFKHDYLTLFKSIKLFNTKGKLFIEKFVREMIVKDYQAGEQILYQDKQCDMLYIIKSGSVTVVNEDKSESYYSFDYCTGEMFGDIEIFLSKTMSQFSVYAGTGACQLFCCQRDSFVKLLGAFISEFNSLTQTKIERIKAKIGELSKSKLFRSKSGTQSIMNGISNYSIWSNSRVEGREGSDNDNDNYNNDYDSNNGNSLQFDYTYDHFHYKDSNTSKEDNYQSKSLLNKQNQSNSTSTKSMLYKRHHFFRRPMKSITAISCKIDESQRLRARETINHMIPIPRISSQSKFKPVLNHLQEQEQTREFFQEAAYNNIFALNNLNQYHSSHLSRSNTLKAFAIRRDDNKKYSHQLNNQEKINMIQTQLKLTPSLFQLQMHRRTTLTKKFIMSKGLMSLLNSNQDLLGSQ